MNIADQFKIYQKYEETIQKLVHALLAFMPIFSWTREPLSMLLLNCNTSYRYYTSPRFIVELCIYYVDFGLQMLGVRLFCWS